MALNSGCPATRILVLVPTTCHLGLNELQTETKGIILFQQREGILVGFGHGVQ